MNKTNRPWLAEVQVDGKQAWIFETNRLRDAVGASYLVAELADRARKHAELRQGDELIAASGLARFRFPSQAQAQEWVTALTTHYTLEAPGMEVLGAVIEIGSGPDALDHAVEKAMGALPEVRLKLGGPAMVDRALPWLRPCDYSGSPAADRRNPVKPEHDAGRRVSEGVFARRQVFRDTRERVELALREAGLDEKLVSTINESVLIHSFGSLDPEAQEAEPLSDRDTWRAVIHMDANGLGRIFRHFGALCKDAKLAEPDGALRAFSSAVNHAAWRAVGRAIEDLIEKTAKLRDDQRPKREVYPLVVGGDDITLVTDGRWGLFLARRLLYHWTNAVAELVRGTSDAGSVVRAVLRAAQQKWAADRLPADHLPACAGVALVKHHFPFSQAYALADDLCREAKQAVRKTSDSALDWHAVFDASPPSLDEIRRRLRAHGLASPVHLTRRPYKVQDFDRLTGAVDLLRKKGDDGRRVLPTSQIQSLRAGLFLGQAEAERRLPLARTRVERPLDELLSALHGEPSLFVGDSTGLLDLIDHDELLEGFSGGAP